MKKVSKVILVLFLTGIIISAVTGTEIAIFGLNSKASKSDAIIVLGCQVRGNSISPFLKSRLDEGIRLYNEGYGKYLIVSGGKGPGENISEADAMKNYLAAQGIPENNIIKEDKSVSTMSNLKNSKVIMDSLELKTAVVISNKYHLKRVSVMSKMNGLDATYSGVYNKGYISFEVYGFLREIPALLRLYILGR